MKRWIAVLLATALLLACIGLANAEGGWTCPQCGRENPERANFCGSCRAPKPEKPVAVSVSSNAWVCSGCGEVCSDQDNFCMYCGETHYANDRPAILTDEVQMLSCTPKQALVETYNGTFHTQGEKREIRYTAPVTGYPALLKTINYSIRDYCAAQIDDGSDYYLAQLCEACLNYGAYSQQYFGYKTTQLANEGYEYDYYTLAYTEVPSAPAAIDKQDGVTKITGSLTLQYKTELNFYFYGGDASADVDVSSDGMSNGNVTVEVHDEPAYNRVRVTVKGIAARYLADNFFVTLGNSFVEYSPLTYMYLNRNDTDVGLVCKALYRYYDAAETYFVNQ